MDEPEESAVRVTMRPSTSEGAADSAEAGGAADAESEAVAAHEDSAVDEWETESSGGEATTVDPDALSRLRAAEASKASPAVGSEASRETVSAEAASEFAEAADEFASAPATVMEDVEQLSAVELLEVVESGDFGGKATEEFEDDSVTRMDPRSAASMLQAEEDPVKEECPSCGVLVLPGYPNCPRCKKSLLPGGGREHKAAGGTSLGGRTIPWTIVFIAAVLTAIIVYLSEREPKIPENEPASESSQGHPEVPASGQAVEAEADEADVADVADEADEADVADEDSQATD